MRHRVTVKRLENYDIEVDYDTESSKVWVIINYKSRKSLQTIEKEFEGKGAIKQAQEYLELFLGILNDKKELETKATPTEIVTKTLEKVHDVKSVMAVSFNKELLKVNVVLQDENEEVIHLTLSNAHGQSLSHKLQQSLRILDTEIYIARNQEKKKEVTA